MKAHSLQKTEGEPNFVNKEAKAQIDKALEGISPSEHKTFETSKDFYEYIKQQGVTVSFDNVKAVLLDMRKMSKQELDIEILDEVAGGGQVEINNTIKNNTKSVKVGPVIVIGM